jgi:hypothetical protein
VSIKRRVSRRKFSERKPNAPSRKVALDLESAILRLIVDGSRGGIDHRHHFSKDVLPSSLLFPLFPLQPRHLPPPLPLLPLALSPLAFLD